MNMIPCDKNCRHQCEGYCGLNSITRLTNEADVSAKCGYYEPYSAKNNAADYESQRQIGYNRLT